MITPSQIREKNLSTVQSGGYDKEEVNALLSQIVESYQAVYDENKELYRKMEIPVSYTHLTLPTILRV